MHIFRVGLAVTIMQPTKVTIYHVNIVKNRQRVGLNGTADTIISLDKSCSHCMGIAIDRKNVG